MAKQYYYIWEGPIEHSSGIVIGFKSKRIALKHADNHHPSSNIHIEVIDFARPDDIYTGH